MTRSFMICAPHQYSGDQIQKNEIGGECGSYERQEKCIQDFGEETWVKETTRKTRPRWEANIKMDLQEEGWGEGLNWSGSEYRRMAGSC